MSTTEQVIVDLEQQRDTVTTVLNQLNRFGTPQQAYLLTGDIIKFRTDFAKTIILINELIEKYKGLASAPVQTTLVHESGIGKQDTHPKRRRTSVDRK